SPAAAEVPGPIAEVVAPLAPLQLGPNGDDSEPSQDLWRIVSFDTARAESTGTSALEDAISRVDASLLAMVEEADAIDPPEVVAPPPAEATFEAEVIVDPVADATISAAPDDLSSPEDAPAPWNDATPFADEAEAVVV